jgi:hypothetical protein
MSLSSKFLITLAFLMVRINAGIVRLVYIAYRVDENAMNFLKAAEIEVVQNNYKPATLQAE